MNLGSCWPSSSIVTIQSEPVDVIPASVAGCWPKLRASQTGRHERVLLGQRSHHVVGPVVAVVVDEHDLVDAVRDDRPAWSASRCAGSAP